MPLSKKFETVPYSLSQIIQALLPGFLQRIPIKSQNFDGISCARINVVQVGKPPRGKVTELVDKEK